MAVLFSNQIFGAIIRYNCADHNDSISKIIFYSNISVGLNRTIENSTDIIRPFIILEYSNNLIHLKNLQIILISFDTNFHITFHIWDRVQLFLHTSFSEAKNHYICDNNESYHNLTINDSMNDCRFDIPFSPHDENLTTLEIDFLMLELTFE
jgi:hypothetical protein